MRSRFLQFFFQKKLFVITSIVVLFWTPLVVSAASLSLSPSTTTLSQNSTVAIKISVHTAGVAINNAEATIQFPADLLEVVSVSKNASIFSLWVEEPRFSNSAGTITFNGGAANPGFTGTNGSIATITFKAKKVGTASVTFADAAVRKNDGLGTDVLTAKNASTIQITAPKDTGDASIPAVISNTIAKPVIVSDSHPNQNVWYSNSTASFSWKVPKEATLVLTQLNKTSSFVPTVSYDNSVTQKTLAGLADGTYYFHLRYVTAQGMSPIAHYRVNIDTVPPDPFTASVRSVGTKDFLVVSAEDELSGVEYYTVETGTAPLVKFEHSSTGEYPLPVFTEGEHVLTVTAFDKAGNHTATQVSFTSSSSIPPTLALSSQEIKKGDSVIIYGKSEYPKQQVEVTLTADGQIVKTYTQDVSPDGSFSIVADRIKTVGIVTIVAKNVFSGSVQGRASESVYLTVREAELVKVTVALMWIIAAAVLVILLIMMVSIAWSKFRHLRNKTRKGVAYAIKDAHDAMVLLKSELINQLAILEKVRIDRDLNASEEKIFAEIQNKIDEIDLFIDKELHKLL